MGEKLGGAGFREAVGARRDPTRIDYDVRQPTSRWKLDYFKTKGDEYFVVKDEEDMPVRTIRGYQARLLRQILTLQNPDVTDDIVNAFRPLVLEAFKEEVGLYEEDQVYANELKDRQPRIYDREPLEGVYRRYWTGHLMRNKISARDVAERIVKSEDRVRVALAMGNIGEEYIKDKVGELAALIKEYHPRGSKGGSR